MEATELLGLMTWAGCTDFLKPGLSDTPQNAGLEGDMTSPGREANAGLDSLPKSLSAGLDTEALTPAALKWVPNETAIPISIEFKEVND